MPKDDWVYLAHKLPWREIIGMRHRIVHGYPEVDEDVIWVVTQQDLPPLIGAIESILPADYW